MASIVESLLDEFQTALATVTAIKRIYQGAVTVEAAGDYPAVCILFESESLDSEATACNRLAKTVNVSLLCYSNTSDTPRAEILGLQKLATDAVMAAFDAGTIRANVRADTGADVGMIWPTGAKTVWYPANNSDHGRIELGFTAHVRHNLKTF